MTDYSVYKIPVIEGINDIPVAPDEDSSGAGCNGAYYIDKYNSSLDTIAADIDSKFDIPTGTTTEYVRGDGSIATLPEGSSTIVAAGSNINVSQLGSTYTVSTHAANLIENGTSKVEIASSNGAITANVANTRSVLIDSSNLALGHSAGTNLISGTNNIIIGKNAQASATSISNEITLGSTAQTLRIPGQNFKATRSLLEWDNTSFESSTGITQGTFRIGWLPDTADKSSICFGANALGNFTGYYNSSFNVAVGYKAIPSLVSGAYNTALGALTLASAVGSAAGPSDGGSGARCYHNTAIGYQALTSFLDGQYNVALGHAAGQGLIEGDFNTILGSRFTNVTQITSGSNNAIIGCNASPSSATISNEITLGNSAVTTLRCAVTSITSLSDFRDKKNIRALPVGLDFVTNYLNPVRFTWDTRDGSKVDLEDYGFIAQDLKQAQEITNNEWLNLVLDNNPDRLEASPGKLIPVLVKAIQDLNLKVENLTQQLTELQNA